MKLTRAARIAILLFLLLVWLPLMVWLLTIYFGMTVDRLLLRWPK